MIENQGFFDIISQPKNTTVDYKVLNSYTYTPDKGGANKNVEMRLSMIVPESRIRYTPNYLQKMIGMWV